MGKKIHTPKVIADPIYGIIDVRPVLPMIETEEFQALGDKRQLGMSYLVFPSATHTRRAHSLGAYYATRKLADRWLNLGFINEEEADALAGYALYHDIGHPAFSHVTEPLCEADISQNPEMSINSLLSLGIIRNLKKTIEACGINSRLVEELAGRKNPLYLAVSDKNLGMEKLDYLERDGFHTILSRPSGIEYLRQHIYFMNGRLAIDEKVVDNAIEAQNFYLQMYKNVYLRKVSVIAQRMFHKMVYHLILAGELKASELPQITDSELLGLMRFSKDKTVTTLYTLLKSRNLFKEAVVVRPEGFVHAEAKAGKNIAVFGIKDKEMQVLVKAPQLQLKNPAELEKLEGKLGEIAGIPVEFVLVVPVTSPKRFTAQDILIYTEKGLVSLRERYPVHFKEMEEVGKSYLALRICTLEKHRKQLSAPAVAQKVLDFVVQTTKASQ